MNVYWLEQTEADVPAENDWLSASETVCLNGMRFAKRRDDWRLGRWTAKRALSLTLNVPAHVQALKKSRYAGDVRRAGGLFRQPTGGRHYFTQPPLRHRGCAVAISGVEMGCDLEIVEPRSDAFVADYFTIEEQALVARASAADRDRSWPCFGAGKRARSKRCVQGSDSTPGL